MKIPPPIETDRHRDLARRVEGALKSWRRFLVGLDGVEGAGKSTLARYLAWRLGMPAVHTDMFLVPNNSKPGASKWLEYRRPELKSVLHSRLDAGKPIIVEGVCLLHTLEDVGLSPDYLVYVEEEGTDPGPTLQNMHTKYTEQYTPKKRAHEVFRWQRPVPEA